MFPLITLAPALASLPSDLSLGSGNYYNDVMIIAVIVVLISVLAAAFVIQRAMSAILKLTMPELLQQEKAEKAQKKILQKARWNNILGLRPISEEKDIMIDHDFDGITELDNPIPIWFNALFYSTVTFGIIYLLIYQVFGWGMNQDQEYVHEMAIAEKEKQAYLAQAANLIDESSIEVNATMIAAGAAIFQANCAACHGDAGQGGIGPNLADKFWIHGGEIKDVFKTVKYGVPDKGMVPWEQTLSPAQIAEVSNYVLSLRGTNPAGAKEAQGVEVTYESAAAEPQKEEVL
ncbi:c-type cytochrome [Sphingobacteriaceae bacterium WQ 2009]|uniref:C-type cytochrome n=1 Tax=Rhinopithecimicrobium faecis TaxID=2820698 RepID=A0A8T4HCY4_9SPHI|nr:c-type cytochrome [Sphingobacteriaceae bacterium WQ 2009]